MSAGPDSDIRDLSAERSRADQLEIRRRGDLIGQQRADQSPSPALSSFGCRRWRPVRRDVSSCSEDVVSGGVGASRSIVDVVNKERDAYEGTPLVEVVASKADRHDIERFHIAQISACFSERVLDRSVRTL